MITVWRYKSNFLVMHKIQEPPVKPGACSILYQTGELLFCAGFYVSRNYSCGKVAKQNLELLHCFPIFFAKVNKNAL